MKLDSPLRSLTRKDALKRERDREMFSKKLSNLSHLLPVVVVRWLPSCSVDGKFVVIPFYRKIFIYFIRCNQQILLHLPTISQFL